MEVFSTILSVGKSFKRTGIDSSLNGRIHPLLRDFFYFLKIEIELRDVFIADSISVFVRTMIIISHSFRAFNFLFIQFW